MTIPALMPVFARCNLAFERGEGAWLFTTDGRRFLDFGSGVAANALGHSHPHLVAALQEQAGKLWHTSNHYQIPGQSALAQRLIAATFADTVFFGNSGAEAVECAIKLARRHHQAQGRNRSRIVVAANAFHGRTLATLAAGGKAKHLEGFQPIVEGFDHVPYGNADEARAAVGEQTAAILVEPIQGEGGVVVPDPQYLAALRRLCDENDLLLMLDEVQSGNGRTGKLYAYEWSGIVPDVLATAKGLGGGFPVGACLASEKAAAAMTAGSHGSTFGGNPLAMAAANAVLDVLLTPGFLDGVQTTAATLHDALKALVARRPTVFEDVRGQGLFIGLKLRDPFVSSALVEALIEQNMLTIPADQNVVRLLPPLIVGQTEIDAALAALESAAARLTA